LGNLSTPPSVQKLQMALHAKAKAEAGYRFYALYDKISREDTTTLAGPYEVLTIHRSTSTYGWKSKSPARRADRGSLKRHGRQGDRVVACALFAIEATTRGDS